MMNILTHTVASLMSFPAAMTVTPQPAQPGTLRIINARIPMSLREITLPDGTVVTLH